MSIISLFDFLNWLKLELKEHELTPELKDCIRDLKEINPNIKVQIDTKMATPVNVKTTYNYVGDYKGKIVNMSFYVNTPMLPSIRVEVPTFEHYIKADNTLGLSTLLDMLKSIDNIGCD